MAKGTVGASGLRHVHLAGVHTARRAARWPGCTRGCTQCSCRVWTENTSQVRALAYTHPAVLPAPSAIQPPEAPAQGTLASS